MALDLRIVIGRLLLAIGIQLVLYGAFSDGRSHILNVSWGLAITAAGGLFHLFPRLEKKA
jgi:hypothetical protein